MQEQQPGSTGGGRQQLRKPQFNPESDWDSALAAQYAKRQGRKVLLCNLGSVVLIGSVGLAVYLIAGFFSGLNWGDATVAAL